MTEAAAQVEVLSQQLELLKGQFAKFEAHAMTAKERTTKAQEEASLLKEELLQRLSDVVEDFQNNKAFDKKAGLWSRDALVQAFRDLSKDIMNVDSKFPLVTLPSMKEFMACEARLKEAKVDAEEEYDSWNDSEFPESLHFVNPGAPLKQKPSRLRRVYPRRCLCLKLERLASLLLLMKTLLHPTLYNLRVFI